MHIDLKQYGITWQEIADELGVSVSTPRVWGVRGKLERLGYKFKNGVPFMALP